MAACLHSDIGASMSKVRSNVARTMHVRILKNNLQKVKCFEKDFATFILLGNAIFRKNCMIHVLNNHMLIIHHSFTT